MYKVTALLTWISLALVGCQSGISANEGGSSPINDAEALQYEKAVARCYKTGGSRVVKIMGKLRCY